MTVGPKKYRASGWVGDSRFTLKADDRNRLVARGLTDDDLSVVESIATRHLVQKSLEGDAPSGAEIHASLAAGEKAVENLRNWLFSVDDGTRDLIESESLLDAHVIPDLANLDRDLGALVRGLHAARMDAPTAKGRPVDSSKIGLAHIILRAFPGRETAYDILRSVLAGCSKRQLNSLLNAADTSENK